MESLLRLRNKHFIIIRDIYYTYHDLMGEKKKGDTAFKFIYDNEAKQKSWPVWANPQTAIISIVQHAEKCISN